MDSFDAAAAADTVVGSVGSSSVMVATAAGNGDDESRVAVDDGSGRAMG